MKVFALALAMAVPLLAPWDEEARPPSLRPLHVGIDLEVRAALPWGEVQWTVLRSDADPVRAQYGITFSWATADQPCESVRVRLRVVVENEGLPSKVVSSDRARRCGAVDHRG